VPRYYANIVNVATGPYDMTVTFLDIDITAIEDAPGMPAGVSHKPALRSECQVVMSLGHVKAMVPLIVKAIADYETRNGVIPAPGFDESSKG